MAESETHKKISQIRENLDFIWCWGRRWVCFSSFLVKKMIHCFHFRKTKRADSVWVSSLGLFFVEAWIISSFLYFLCTKNNFFFKRNKQSCFNFHSFLSEGWVVLVSKLWFILFNHEQLGCFSVFWFIVCLLFTQIPYELRYDFSFLDKFTVLAQKALIGLNLCRKVTLCLKQTATFTHWCTFTTIDYYNNNIILW